MNTYQFDWGLAQMHISRFVSCHLLDPLQDDFYYHQCDIAESVWDHNLLQGAKG